MLQPVILVILCCFLVGNRQRLRDLVRDKIFYVYHATTALRCHFVFVGMFFLWKPYVRGYWRGRQLNCFNDQSTHLVTTQKVIEINTETFEFTKAEIRNETHTNSFVCETDQIRLHDWI